MEEELAAAAVEDVDEAPLVAVAVPVRLLVADAPLFALLVLVLATITLSSSALAGPPNRHSATVPGSCTRHS